MLITDYSQQNLENNNSHSPVSLSEVITAGMVFILPIVFLLVIAAA